MSRSGCFQGEAMAYSDFRRQLLHWSSDSDESRSSSGGDDDSDVEEERERKLEEALDSIRANAIERVCLADEGLRCYHADQLSEVLWGNVSVTSLDLSDNRIKDSGIWEVAEAMKKSRVTDLDLSCNKIGDSGAMAIAKALKQSVITDLDLSGNCITTEGALLLAAALPDSTVTSLDLAANDIWGFRVGEGLEEGLVSVDLSTLLRARLTDLSLNANNFQVDHVFTEALKASCLESLSLERTLIRQREMEFLAAALPNSCLTSLDLCFNLIKAEGVQALSLVLKDSALRSLALGFNAIGDEGAAYMAEGLQGSKLTHLYLPKCCIGEIGGQALLQEPRGTQVTSLDLQGNSVSIETSEQIQALLEFNSPEAAPTDCGPMPTVEDYYAAVPLIARLRHQG